MKNFKFLALCLMVLTMSVLSSCKKDPVTKVESTEFTLTASDWVGNAASYAASKTISAITADVASNGVVLCYWKLNGSYVPLPWTYTTGDGNGNSWIRHIVFEHNSSTVTLTYYDSDGATPNPGSLTFKVVAISQSALTQNPTVDLNNYEAVKTAFGVE